MVRKMTKGLHETGPRGRSVRPPSVRVELRVVVDKRFYQHPCIGNVAPANAVKHPNFRNVNFHYLLDKPTAVPFPYNMQRHICRLDVFSVKRFLKDVPGLEPFADTRLSRPFSCGVRAPCDVPEPTLCKWIVEIAISKISSGGIILSFGLYGTTTAAAHPFGARITHSRSKRFTQLTVTEGATGKITSTRKTEGH
jgi:hypothetical protein